MRGVLLGLTFAFAMAVAAPSKAAIQTGSAAPTVSAASASYYLQQSPEKDINVDINVNRGGGVRWYRNPMWIAIAAIGGVLVLLLLVMAVRSGGGGTTIVKD